MVTINGKTLTLYLKKNIMKKDLINIVTDITIFK